MTVRVLSVLVGLSIVGSGLAFGWTRFAAAGHLYGEADAPRVDVAIVLGAQVAPGGAAPMPVLRGRLETAARLVRAGRARVLLVSGDAHGTSGNEVTVMTGYLVGPLEVNADRLVVDPDGLDTYDSCVRARRVYGVRRALVVTQPFHLARAVTLCRHAGIDADGVRASCVGCRTVTLARNTGRDYLACTKAAVDAITDRPPAVDAPPSSAVTDALARN